MTSEQFHTAIVECIKSAFAAWDSGSNPFDWEGIPTSVAGIMENAVQQAIVNSRNDIYGAPFYIDHGEFSGANYEVHTPNPDAVVAIAFKLFDDGDFSEFCVDSEVKGVRFNLADAIMAEAESEWAVADAIQQLEATITKLKQQAAARDWDLS